METKTIFNLLCQKPDLCIWLILFLAILTYSSDGYINSPSHNEEENWDPLSMICKLTPEQIRSEPGYENLSDEEVNNIIESNYQLSLIAYNHYKSNQHNFYISE